MLCATYPFFILQRSLWEYQGQGSSGPRTIPCPDGLVRRLLCLLKGKISIYKKNREAKNKARREVKSGQAVSWDEGKLLKKEKR